MCVWVVTAAADLAGAELSWFLLQASATPYEEHAYAMLLDWQKGATGRDYWGPIKRSPAHSQRMGPTASQDPALKFQACSDSSRRWAEGWGSLP